MFVVATVAILISFALVMVRAVKGPSVFDRALAGNAIGMLAILLLAAIGFLTERPELLDIALTHRRQNLIGTLVVLELFCDGTLALYSEVEGPTYRTSSSKC